MVLSRCSFLISAAAATIALLSISNTAQAQSTGATPTDQANGNASSEGLQDIVVTARRREENLQETPIAVTAVTADAIAERGISNLSEIAASTPSLRFDSGAAISGSSNTATVFIRGIGQTDFNLTIDPGVGIYLDGVFISRSVGALIETTDVERIEVLRGPQGTLFGKNTIGGAVSITSRQPNDERSMSGDFTIGSFNRIDARASINVPVADGFSILATAATINRDGNVRRLVDGDRAGNRNQLFGRIVARAELSPDWTVKGAFDITQVRESTIGATALRIYEENPSPATIGVHFPTIWNQQIFAAQCAPTVASRLTNPNCFNQQYVTGDPDATFVSGKNRSDSDTYGLSLTVEGQIGSIGVKSITAYRNLESIFELDTDASPIPITTTANDYSQNQFSQELQFSGNLFGDRVSYLFGLYYLRERGNDVNTLSAVAADFQSGGRVENQSYAAFSQIGIDITDRLNLTLGGRYTSERKNFLPDQFLIADRTPGEQLKFLSRCFISRTPVVPPGPGCAIDPVLNPNGNRILPFIEVSRRFNEFTPAVTLDFQANDDVLAYLTYSRGFKSGGFTQRIFPPIPETPSFAPEFATTYEFGVKAELFNRRVRWNSAVFYNDYSDLQIIVTEGLAPTVRNAGAARIWGVESEFQAVLASWLRFDGSLSYLNAKYKKVSPLALPVTIASRLVNTPEWQSSLGATATVFTNDSLEVRLRGDLSYSSSLAKDAENTRELIQRAYTLLGSNLTFARPDDALAFSVGVTNLTDERYLVTGNYNPSIGTVYGVFNRPREFYARLRFSF
jgi:iron complex outermembrane recepter protein